MSSISVVILLKVYFGHRSFLFYMMINPIIAYFINWFSSEPDLNVRHNPRRDDTNASKIFQYCAQGDIQRLKKVLREHQHSIDINAKKGDGSTPMHLAIEGNHLPIVKILTSNFDLSLNTLVRNGQNHDMLDLSIIKKNNEIFKLILSLTPTPNISSLALAVTTKQVNMVKQLIPKIPSQFMTEIAEPLNIFCEKTKEYAKSGSNMKKAQKNQAKKNLDFFKDIITRDLQNRRKKNESINNNSIDDDEENEFECPICFIPIVAPNQIFGCSNDHILCSNCLEDLGTVHILRRKNLAIFLIL